MRITDYYGPISAVLFDCNGVVADDEHIYEEAIAMLVRTHTRLELTRAVYDEHCKHRTDVDGLERLRAAGYLPSDIPVEHLLEEKDVNYFILLEHPSKALVPGALDFIASTTELGIPVAMVTAASAPWVPWFLSGTGLDEVFREPKTLSMNLHGPMRKEKMAEHLHNWSALPGRPLLIDDSEGNLRDARDLGYLLLSLRVDDYTSTVAPITANNVLNLTW